MNGFAIEGPGRTVFGAGKAAELAAEVELLGGGPVLLVVDPNVLEAKVAQPAIESLEKAGVKYEIYSDITREPEPSEADEAAKLGRVLGAQLVAGIGGGSALDLAKAASVLITNEGQATDYVGLDLIPNPGKPVICLPTTAGTGSEVTFTAVFTRRADGFKGGMNGRLLYPSTALLDPLLTVSCPPYITAVGHGCSYPRHGGLHQPAGPRAERPQRAQGHRAHLRQPAQAVAHGENLEARSNMLLVPISPVWPWPRPGWARCTPWPIPWAPFSISPTAKPTRSSALCAGIQPDGLPRALRGHGLYHVGAAGRLQHPHGGRSLRGRGVHPFDRSGIPPSLDQLDVPKDDIPRMAEKAMTVARPLPTTPQGNGRRSGLHLPDRFRGVASRRPLG